MGVPFTIHSAIARPAPPAWVTQIASATQTPRTSSDSPRSDWASGVKENMPLIVSTSGTSPKEGKSSIAQACEGAKCSGKKGNRAVGAGPFGPHPALPRVGDGSVVMSTGSTSRGSWR